MKESIMPSKLKLWGGGRGARDRRGQEGLGGTKFPLFFVLVI